MIIQHCLKGVSGIDEATALSIISGGGIKCNWWRHQGTITANEIQRKLNAHSLDLHVNNYSAVQVDTPYISLSAGCVERDTTKKKNIVHSARETALQFATDFGHAKGFLFYCWVVVSAKPTPEVEYLAEEVRDPNSNRWYSDYQTEGEITAKVHVPSNQIMGFEEVDERGCVINWVSNPTFTPASRVDNVRGVL